MIVICALATLMAIGIIFSSCSDVPATPIPKIYSWQDCGDNKDDAASMFTRCLDKIGFYAMSSYPSGERFSPRDCERLAIALYCIPSAKPNCEKEVAAVTYQYDSAFKTERNKLRDQLNSCKASAREVQNCPKFGNFITECSKTHRVTVEVPDDTPHSN
jgi:hypothetical protein